MSEAEVGDGEGQPRVAAQGDGPVYAGRLAFTWSPEYRSAWDATPDTYVTAGVVAWGRSRRLVRVDDPVRAFKAYLGIQHYDPAMWQVAGEARAKFFLSLFLAGRTITLSTYPTFGAAREALEAFHARLTP